MKNVLLILSRNGQGTKIEAKLRDDEAELLTKKLTEDGNSADLYAFAAYTGVLNHIRPCDVLTYQIQEPPAAPLELGKTRG